MKKKLHNRITYFPFILLGIIIIYLIINSFIGKTLQNSTDIPNLYTSTPLLFLWGLLGVTGMVVLLRNGDGRKMPLLLFHCSLILILLGACVTHFTHESGILHLRKGVEKNKFVSFQENRLIKLPFYLSLSEFNVINYPGTTTPADYKAIAPANVVSVGLRHCCQTEEKHQEHRERTLTTEEIAQPSRFALPFQKQNINE